MKFEIDDAVIRQAKTPHELSMLNLVAFHLLAAPASIVLDIGLLGFLVPLALSLSFITFVWIRARHSREQGPWFVAAHWRLSANRTKILMIGYIITGAILGFAFLVTSGSSKGDIMMVALSRVAAVPVLITVMICFVLESSSIYQAGRGEVPDGLVKRFPPPAKLVVKQELEPSAVEPASKVR
ncbi:MAG: hypothetical protein QNJ78_01685 [Gammaproteobacteria bacterium]|nr:hypothetical protein [Gammaproteobacteria bacterium]